MIKNLFKKLLSAFLITSLLFTPVFAESKYGQSKPPLGSQIDWSNPLAKGLVGCWLMNEGGGNRVKNLANNNLGIMSNCIWTPNGIDFNGSNSVITCEDITKLSGNIPMTAIAKINPHTVDATPRYLFSKSGAASSAYGKAIILVSTPHYQFNIDGDTDLSTLSANNSITTNLFQTICAVYDGSSLSANVKLYLNSIILVHATDINLSNFTSDTGKPILIGNRGDGLRPFDGIMQYLYFYNRILSRSEIQQLYIDPYCFIKQDYRLYYVPLSGFTPLSFTLFGSGQLGGMNN